MLCFYRESPNKFRKGTSENYRSPTHIYLIQTLPEDFLWGPESKDKEEDKIHGAATACTLCLRLSQSLEEVAK